MISNDNPVCQKINWTSDHTPVTFSVSQKKEGEMSYTFPILIMTWNKMNQCHSKLNCKVSHPQQAYANNPWDIDEDSRQYANRVALQRQYLTGVIERSVNALHVICLQEVNDLLFGGVGIDDTNHLFQKKLDELGWGIAHSMRKDNCKHLVVLYDRKRFRYIGQEGVIPSAAGKNAGLEVLFEDRITGQSYAATNIHLEWSEDYRRAILDYQIRQVAKGILTTICGDTNHPPALGQFSFVGNGKFPTNINVNHLGDITTSDERHNVLRHYDSLAASPAKGCLVRIAERNGLYFAKGAEGYVVKEFDPERDYQGHPYVHESEVGKPWSCSKKCI